MPDREIWSYARVHSLTIITRDGDFSEQIMLEGAPPRAVHPFRKYEVASKENIFRRDME